MPKYKIKETRTSESFFLVYAKDEEDVEEKIWDSVVYEDPYYECELNPEITIERVKENADI
jgi:hypothetical protein